MSGNDAYYGPVAGSIVHFAIDDCVRPMIVTQAWSNECVNGIVFRDGTNDDKDSILNRDESPDLLSHWKTSVHHDASGAPGTWHWPGELDELPVQSLLGVGPAPISAPAFLPDVTVIAPTPDPTPLV